LSHSIGWSAAHTSFSLDAFSWSTRNTPLDAYAFARGKTLQVSGASPDGGGPLTTIDRPLDFLAVTDHSEWLADTYGCGTDLAGVPYDPASPYFDSGTCATVRSTNPADQDAVFANQEGLSDELCEAGGCGLVALSAWQLEQQAAAATYVPCTFTTFVAYEWTYEAAGAAHKNVVFATDQVPSAPLDSRSYPVPLSLWQGLESQCLADAGCVALTIPHNSNQSNGIAFDVPDGGGALMAKYQKLVEVFQHKGNSECFYDPDGGTTDRDCDFEYAGGVNQTNDPGSYVRTGLEQGLVSVAAGQGNPLQMGIVGGTDDHNGTPGNTRETTWPGHMGREDDTSEKRVSTGANDVFRNPGGLTGVWAEENTRDAIFAALARRETFATSGTRMLVRFYQTWQPTDPCSDPSFPSQIVAGGGVPMGGAFGASSGGAAGPWLVVSAWKDAADLARVDIIKAWVDAGGQVQETVVSTPTASGAHACVFWQDASFVPGPTLYYARVLEVPTPRWSVGDCAVAGASNPAQCADGGALNVMIQERAWTSPIWYQP
jgi:hypothetical protein